MRKNLFFFLILAAAVLAGCGNRSSNIPVVDSAPQAHLFQMTPTASGEKGEENEAQAHAVGTPTYLPGYPTPLSTYVVPSRLIKITYAPTQGQPTTIPPTGTPTKTPTRTPTPSTPTSIPPTATPTPLYFYAVQPGSPAMLPNFANASAGCNWQGIAGQVFNADGLPVNNLVVKAGGTWNGAAVNSAGYDRDLNSLR